VGVGTRQRTLGPSITGIPVPPGAGGDGTAPAAAFTLPGKVPGGAGSAAHLEASGKSGEPAYRSCGVRQLVPGLTPGRWGSVLWGLVVSPPR